MVVRHRRQSEHIVKFNAWSDRRADDTQMTFERNLTQVKSEQNAR